MKIGPCLVIFLALLVVGITGIPAFAESKPSSDELRVGVLAPLTGDYAAAGEEIARGVNLAKTVLSGEGIEVKVTIEDACLPAQGVSALRKMVEIDKIEAIASNYCVISLNAIRPLLEKNKLITFHNSTVPRELVASSPYVFSTWHSIEDEVASIVGAIGDKALRRAGVVHLVNPWGASFAKSFRERVAALGYQLTIDSAQQVGVHDFRAELARVRSTKSEAILAAHTGDVMASFLKQAYALKIPGTMIFVPSDNDKHEIISAAGPAAEGITLFSTDGPDSTQKEESFRVNFFATYGRNPDPLSRHAYDQLMLLASSMTRCKKDVACAISRLGSTNEYVGASGIFSINEKGLTQRKLFRKQVKKGKLEFK